MSLLNLVLVLIAVGVLLYLFNVYFTMIDGTVKQIINAIVIIALIVFVCNAIGLFDFASQVKVPHV